MARRKKVVVGKMTSQVMGLMRMVLRKAIDKRMRRNRKEEWKKFIEEIKNAKNTSPPIVRRGASAFSSSFHAFLMQNKALILRARAEGVCGACVRVAILRSYSVSVHVFWQLKEQQMTRLRK
jgi:hypothetical protein